MGYPPTPSVPLFWGGSGPVLTKGGRLAIDVLEVVHTLLYTVPYHTHPPHHFRCSVGIVRGRVRPRRARDATTTTNPEDVAVGWIYTSDQPRDSLLFLVLWKHPRDSLPEMNTAPSTR